LGAAREAPSATSAAATPAPQTPAAPAASALAAPSTAATSVAPVNTIISDRLHRILGINGEAERLLLANGVTRFSQIAAWTQADVDRFDHLLGKPGRIGRENWVEQAKVLVRGAEDADSNRPVRLADAIRDNAAAGQPRAPRSDLGHLRSVRSEALRGEPPEVVRPSILARPVGGFEDLKRIRGIGVLIEKKLNSLGIISYEQIANWTGADIDRISQILDFKGRIERENWVEQARILAAGGNTEFSRRMDRGDM
jgi:predicted flap endonuclease-1-like 5' DNA nuclease